MLSSNSGEGPKKGKANPWMRFKSFCVKALAEKCESISNPSNLCLADVISFFSNVLLIHLFVIIVPPSEDKPEWGAYNKKLSKIWKGFTSNQRDIFRDPFFFALANLPDLSNIPPENNADADMDEAGPEDTTVERQPEDATTTAPAAQKLTDEEYCKYQPIFDELVDIEKLHWCHGKPDASKSVASLQQRSLLELRKAHHSVRFSVLIPLIHLVLMILAQLSVCSSMSAISDRILLNIR